MGRQGMTQTPSAASPSRASKNCTEARDFPVAVKVEESSPNDAQRKVAPNLNATEVERPGSPSSESKDAQRRLVLQSLNGFKAARGAANPNKKEQAAERKGGRRGRKKKIIPRQRCPTPEIMRGSPGSNARAGDAAAGSRALNKQQQQQQQTLLPVHDTCIMCGCVMTPSVDRRYKDLGVLAAMVRHSCRPTPYVYQFILDADRSIPAGERRSVASCIACINWIRRMEFVCCAGESQFPEDPDAEGFLAAASPTQGGRDAPKGGLGQLLQRGTTTTPRGATDCSVRTPSDDSVSGDDFRDDESECWGNDLEDDTSAFRRRLAQIVLANNNQDEGADMHVLPRRRVSGSSTGSGAARMVRVFRGKCKNSLIIPLDHLLLFLGDPGTRVTGSNPDRRSMYRLLCSLTAAPELDPGGHVVRNPYLMFSTPVVDRSLSMFRDVYYRPCGAPPCGGNADASPCGDGTKSRGRRARDRGRQEEGSIPQRQRHVFPTISAEESTALVDDLVMCWWQSVGMPCILPHRECARLVRRSVHVARAGADGEDLESLD